ncbi:type IV pilin N-terminal domain-containing protein [Methanorbis rubei]|uniref:Archaeal Type IV pilin N-terminal domain-containing protein n=1 Tax=Methanorbis rubei TaxID=3028300 RepID=A0AAE4MEL3_9EURY|nr:hypothetical protein [Methanocorpusculaceae archaeon Cs1]
MKTDEGISPVIAIVVLIGLVIIAGAIIGLTMFASMENASGTLPDVRFQVSADGVSLYHAGGDSLPLKNLIFYDTSARQSMVVQLIKSGSDSAVPDNQFELNVWETGDKIRIIGGKLDVLSIVGPDSRNHPALLYMGVNAAVLPIGDMVPDEWIEIIVPVEPPEKPEDPKGLTALNEMLLLLTIGNTNIIDGKNDMFKQYPDYYQYTGSISGGSFTINLETNSYGANYDGDRNIHVAFFNQTGEQIGGGNNYSFGNARKTQVMSIPAGVMPGDWCYMTISGKNKNTGQIDSVTIIIRMGYPAETG